MARVVLIAVLVAATTTSCASSSTNVTCPLAQRPLRRRPRAVLLAYTWGTGPSSCSPYFVRSWVALPPEERARTDLVILWEGKDQPCAGEPAGGGAKYFKMPSVQLSTLKATKLSPAAYRMRAFTWWLTLPENAAAGYGYVGVLDTDMLFQSDIFDSLHAFIRSKHELHMISENPAERNDGYTTRRLRDWPACHAPILRYLSNTSVLPVLPPAEGEAVTAVGLNDGSGGSEPSSGRRLRQSRASTKSTIVAANPPTVTRFWERFGATHRLNFGSMFGTLDAMVALCEQVVDVLIGPMSMCWDQGMLNVLVWAGLVGTSSTSHASSSRSTLPTSTSSSSAATTSAAEPIPHSHYGRRRVTRVVVWDCFDGPVRTLDVGSLRDASGKFYNELGALQPRKHAP